MGTASRLAMLLAGAAFCVAAVAKPAEAYPDRPVSIVIPFGAGSITDAVSRLIAHELGEALGQRFIVENMPGANGALAATHVAQSDADGYTLFITTNTTQAANPAGMLRSIDYDPLTDFASITRVGNIASMIVVNPDVPASAAEELIEYARENPATLNYATGNSTGIVAGATFTARTQTELGHIPYRSTPEGLNDVVAGRVQMMITDVMTGAPHVESGDLSAIALVTAERSDLLPDVPTLRETGMDEFADFDFTAWFAMFAPAGTPDEAVSTLVETTHEVLDREDVRERMMEMGFAPVKSTPGELDDLVASEIERWRGLLEEAAFEPM